MLRTLCSSRLPAARGSRAGGRSGSDDEGSQRARGTAEYQLSDDGVDARSASVGPQAEANTRKHGLLTAVAFAALAGALAICDIDAHDVLPHFTDLQLSLLLDELDYTTLMLIDAAMRYVTAVPPMM